MRRHINSTGRRRIVQEHVAISIRPAEGDKASVFDLDLDLGGYGFPPDARVRVEASRSNAGQTWDYGTVGRRSEPPDDERRLTEFDGKPPPFRVMVVAGDGSGRLLGSAMHVVPRLPQDSLIHLQEHDGLGDEVWRIEFGDMAEPPVLLVNRSIPGASEIVRSDAAFRALVMPEVLRAILTRIVLVERMDEDSNEGGAWRDWLRFAQSRLPGRDIPADDEEPDTGAALEWIDDAVRAFAGQPALSAAATYRRARDNAA